MGGGVGECLVGGAGAGGGEDGRGGHGPGEGRLGQGGGGGRLVAGGACKIWRGS